MSHKSDKFWGPSEVVCSIIGLLCGVVSGFDGGGVGGAILGAIIGGVIGVLAGSLFSGTVSYFYPSANPRDFGGAFSTIGIIILVLVAIGIVISLISNLWGVGRR